MRWRLANSLRSAYAAGLLTEDTFAHRIDHLYSGGLVEPDQLVGDLTFRIGARRRTLRDRTARLISRRQGRGAMIDPRLPILALDWTGSTTQVLIGRGSFCDLVIAGETVSRRHVQLYFRDGSWVVVDLDSTNGTYVNGSRVERTHLLPGDSIALGRERLLVD
jgi:hypothetical protein